MSHRALHCETGPTKIGSTGVEKLKVTARMNPNFGETASETQAAQFQLGQILAREIESFRLTERKFGSGWQDSGGRWLRVGNAPGVQLTTDCVDKSFQHTAVCCQGPDPESVPSRWLFQVFCWRQ